MLTKNFYARVTHTANKEREREREREMPNTRAQLYALTHIHLRKLANVIERRT